METIDAVKESFIIASFLSRTVLKFVYFIYFARWACFSVSVMASFRLFVCRGNLSRALLKVKRFPAMSGDAGRRPKTRAAFVLASNSPVGWQGDACELPHMPPKHGSHCCQIISRLCRIFGIFARFSHSDHFLGVVADYREKSQRGKY